MQRTRQLEDKVSSRQAPFPHSLLSAPDRTRHHPKITYNKYPI